MSLALIKIGSTTQAKKPLVETLSTCATLLKKNIFAQ
jgi:hypothetical protein